MGDVDEVKSRLNIVDVIGERVTLKKAGRNFKGLCPFHTEKTPSFMVSPERQTFHCFGCQKGGSVIDFVMEYGHMEFREALEELAGRAGVTLKRPEGRTQEEQRKEKLYEINALASEYYQYILAKHALGEKARMYLKQRGISDKSIRTFGIGYSPNSWEALHTYLRKKNYDDRILEQAGLIIGRRTSDIGYQTKNIRHPTSEIRNPGYYDRFRGRIMFTLRDHRGNIAGFSGRVLDPSAKEAKYINTPETPVYSKSNMLFGLDVTKNAIAKAQDVICMEGEIDVISSFQEGIANVVAVKGSSLTEGHLHLLKRFTPTITFCFDSDSAGDAAQRRGIENAEREGFEMRAIILPMGKDPDEAVRTDPVAFKKAVTTAVPMYDFLLDSAQRRYDMTTASGKKKASQELLPILSRMTNAIVRGHYTTKLARMLGVTEEVVDEEMRKVKPTFSDMKPESASTLPAALTRQEKFELYTLALVLQGDARTLWNDLEPLVPMEDISSPAVRKIFLSLRQFFQGDREFRIEEFAKTLPSELLPVIDQAYLWDVSGVVDDGALYREEWQKTVRDLRRLIIRKKMQDINARASDGDESVQEQLAVLTKELSHVEKSP